MDASNFCSQLPSDTNQPHLGCAAHSQANTGERLFRPADPQERLRAISLFYWNRTPQSREKLFHWARRLSSNSPNSFAGLYVAVRGSEIRGVVWARPVPGRQIQIWPPMLVPDEPNETRHKLITSLESYLRDQDASVTYVPVKSKDDAAAVAASGYQYVTDMMKLFCQLPTQLPSHCFPGLEFEYYRASQSNRLKRILTQTNEDSLDCPAMRGLRHVDDVLEGHRSREDYQPAHWRIIRYRGLDVGCVLVSRHQHLNECEVVYLGLSPEARGQGIGYAAIQHAQGLARTAGVSILTLGCDVNNTPALRTYGKAGFREAERYSVFAKISTASQSKLEGRHHLVKQASAHAS